jgi:hypothetical protein
LQPEAPRWLREVARKEGLLHSIRFLEEGMPELF